MDEWQAESYLINIKTLTMWYVYIIKSEELYLYTGITKNIEKRIISHSLGRNYWTKRESNWKLIYSEPHQNVKEARKREKYFKNNAGKEWLKRKGYL